MASPFNIFRKHQKILIATLGLLAMIAFVILPNILQQLGAGSRGADQVVVISKYGNLTEQQIQQLRVRRQRLNSFLQRTIDAAGFDRQEEFYRKLYIEQFFGNASEQSIVDSWIMTQRAKQLGMNISDAVVSEFLRSKAVSDDRVTNQQFAQIYKNLKISENEVFDSLQDELLAQQLQASFATSLLGVPPGLRWDYYQRLNRKMTIQVAALQVADYLDQVEDPEEKVLSEFFEEHKHQLETPNLPRPGFRVPAKVSFAYVKAAFDKYTDVAPVTDAEIEEYYMKNREQRFVKPDLPGLEAGDTSAATKAAEPTAEKTAAESAEQTGDATDARPAEETKFQPLEQVREQIRQTLAEGKKSQAADALKAIEKSLQPIRSAVSKYRSDWNLYRATGDEEGRTEPQKPDFAALAEQHDLGFSDTGLLSAVELSDLDIGSAMVDGQQSFLQYIFNSSSLYRPRICRDMAGNVYLFWKTGSSDTRVAAFEDEGMRDKVLTAWKTVQARDIALADAERLADEARQGKKTLAEAIGSRVDVYASGPFSWLSRAPVGSQGQQRLMLSDVKHVDRPGEDFMQAVFDLQPGQIGLAMNQPKNAVYIFQLEKTSPSDKVLWIGFKADPYSDYAAVARSDQMQLVRRWTDEINNSAHLQWKRNPIASPKNR